MTGLFRDQKLVVKMMGGFILTSIITLLVGFWGVSAVQKDSGSIERIYTRHVKEVSDLKESQIELLRAVGAQKNALVAYTPEQRQANINEMERSQNKFAETLARLGKTATAGERGLQETMERAWSEFHRTNNQVIERLKAEKAEEAFQLSNGAALQTFQAAEQAVQKVVDYRIEESAREYQESISRNQSARVWLSGLSLLGCGLGLGFGFLIAQLVAGPIRRVVDGLQELERGNLTMTLGIESKDEVGVLAATYDSLIVKLRSVMQDVQEASTRVEEAVAQVSSSAGSQSGHRFSRDTPTIEETAAAMHEIAKTAQSNASFASTAAARFTTASERTVQAQSAMEQMINAVSDINESGQKISKIIHVMDEIALKTNLLALNAAVEAAHAGDHGRGFAVVAAEVRSLAQRSAEAAKDITALISDSASKGEAGKSLAVRSGEVLGEITKHMQEVSTLVNNISAESNQQHHAIEGATRSMSAIDKTMQQNAAEVAHLREVVGYFKVEASYR